MPSPSEIERVKELLTQRMDFIQKLMDERQVLADKALELTAVELARRLEILNGEAERLRTMQATYLPREIYDQNLHVLSEAVHKLQTDYANQQGKGQVISIIVSFGISVIIAAFSIIGTRLLGGH